MEGNAFASCRPLVACPASSLGRATVAVVSKPPTRTWPWEAWPAAASAREAVREGRLRVRAAAAIRAVSGRWLRRKVLHRCGCNAAVEAEARMVARAAVWRVEPGRRKAAGCSRGAADSIRGIGHRCLERVCAHGTVGAVQLKVPAQLTIPRPG